MADDRTKISYSISNTRGVQSPMFAFNTLYDTDFGLIYMIGKKYADPEYFDLSFYDKNDTIRKIVLAIYKRKEKNPLSLIINDKYKDQIDDLYNQYFNEKYDDILEYSCYTGVYYLVSVLHVSNDIIPYIFCLDDREVDIISKDANMEGINIITKKNIIGTIGVINQLYVKSLISDPYVKLLSESLDRKSIYVEDYTYNFNNNDLIIDDDSKNFVKHQCFFSMISAFEMDKLVEGESNNDNRTETNNR